MIEWLVLGGIVGLAALLDGDGKKRTPPSTPPFPPSPAQADQPAVAEAMSAWRAQWAKSVLIRRWIPKGEAARVVRRFPPPARGKDRLLGGTNVRTQRELEAEFAAHNRHFLAAEKTRLKSLFDSIEKQPLTDEQVEACICMDDAVLLVAAAGSGKTSTMVAKAAYVVRERLAAPEEVLLLAFNRATARELTDRVAAATGDVAGADRIAADTFNAFGLKVIAEATGAKPRVPYFIGRPEAEAAEIVRIVEALRLSDPAFGQAWDDFRTVYARDLHGSVGSDGGARRLVTAAGERVNSSEERRIAN